VTQKKIPHPHNTRAPTAPDATRGRRAGGAWFVTGTDTSVGKTALTAALVGALRARGAAAIPFKPVQTGGRGRTALDIAAVRRICGLTETNAPDLPSGQIFTPACSPHWAARRAGRELCAAELARAARAVRRHADWIVAEGAGGALTPLNERETMADLMARLGWPVWVAARPGLGTINHTRLTLEALQRRGVPVAGVVFVAARGERPDALERENRRSIEQMTGTPVLGRLPYSPALARGDRPGPAFWRAAKALLRAAPAGARPG